jgi:hypothetical protein
MKDPTVEYIDTISDFFNQRAIAKSMFDKHYHSGVHIGPDGSMCPSMIRKLKVIVYFRKVFLLSKFK